MSAAVSTPSQLDSLIQKATSESIPNGEIDLSLALEVSDVIRSRRVSPKECMRCIKKRITSSRSNPNRSLSAWRLTEVCLKNGGVPFIKEVCSREFMDSLEHAILQDESNDELEILCKGMLQDLYVAFRNDSQLNYVSKVYQRLEARGVEFPSNPSRHSELAAAMFDSKTPADWIDSDTCMICSNKFSLLNRRHHCRSCGGIFCQEHSSRFIPLPDLGIYDNVRVCDNCFDDYETKKQSDKKRKKKKRGHSKSGSVRDQEEEELKKAIELSLKEARSEDTFVPVVPVPKLPSHQTIDEEEDEDLKAAIAASLRESEEAKRKQQERLQTPVAEGYSVPNVPPPLPSNELTTSEEDDIQLFASLVERMKYQPPTAVLEDTQLQQLYRKVMGTVPKLNIALGETSHKYNTLMNMNGKISDIMNIYDSLLEKQLQSINLNQQYFMPQLPSDPYAYYNVGQQNSSHVNSAALPQQNQQTKVPSSTSGRQHLAESSLPSAPISEARPTEGHASPNHIEQLKTIAIEQEASQKQPMSSPRPYPDEAQDDPAPIPSEHYPKEASNNHPTQTPSDPPYPKDDEEKENNLRQAQPKRDEITNFDFPTVPVQQPPLEQHVKEESEEANEPEQLLIEL
ncbi:LAQU0S09e02300g1_1 [Lachancea quebecensis]|uniref:Vacuolar protein sorting-associated protein 27 n=1 Tax=Lachancea quebecensis TaxID=1654605 RepID=A0A0P1KSY8_9SACH|nr:LAQU0S09e02300g1_1 [Lachancea quebecensis]